MFGWGFVLCVCRSGAESVFGSPRVQLQETDNGKSPQRSPPSFQAGSGDGTRERQTLDQIGPRPVLAKVRLEPLQRRFLSVSEEALQRFRPLCGPTDRKHRQIMLT